VIQSWLSFIADELYLDRYVSRICYGVGVCYISFFHLLLYDKP